MMCYVISAPVVQPGEEERAVMKIRISTRFALAWFSFLFVWRHTKEFNEPKRGDHFKLVIEGHIR